MSTRIKNSRQKSDQLELVDSFLNNWVSANGLPADAGLSETERACATQAFNARSLFKEHRKKCFLASLKQPASPNDTEDSMASGASASSDHSYNTHNKKSSLSAVQKYNIRLSNNRLSAHAAKVYNEVYSREISKALFNFEAQQKLSLGYGSTQQTGNGAMDPTVQQISAVAAGLQKENAELKQELASSKLRMEELFAEVEAFRAASVARASPLAGSHLHGAEEVHSRSQGTGAGLLEQEDTTDQSHAYSFIQAPGHVVEYIDTAQKHQQQKQHEQQQIHHHFQQQLQQPQPQQQKIEVARQDYYEKRVIQGPGMPMNFLHPEHQQNNSAAAIEAAYNINLFEPDYFTSAPHHSPPA